MKGSKIRDLRKRKGLSQAELASLIGKTQGSVSQMEGREFIRKSVWENIKKTVR